jgi:hypothetical protein
MTNTPQKYPEVILPKPKPAKIILTKKKKTFTDKEEQELRSIMKYTGYSKAEIQEKVERKRLKYGKTKSVMKGTSEPMNEAEIRKKQIAEKQLKFWEIYTNEIKARWKKLKSSSFKCDISKWHTFMTTPIGKVEMFNSDKKNMIKQVNKYVAEELNKRFNYNDKMANIFLKCGYKKEYIVTILNHLSTHHDMKTI